MSTAFSGSEGAPLAAAPVPLGQVYQHGDTNVVEVSTERAEPSAAPDPSRPAWLPEKFKSGEDLARSYFELERRQSAGPAGQTPPAAAPAGPPATGDALLAIPKPGAAPAAGTPPAGGTAEAAIATASAFFAANGNLDEGQMGALAAAGIPKPVVDAFVATHVRAKAATEAFVFGKFDGEANFKSALASANTILSAPEKAAFDDAMKSQDFGRITMAVDFLKHKTGGGGTRSMVDPTDGLAAFGGGEQAYGPGELEAAQRDPRYATSETFRLGVERRLAASMRRR